MTPLELFWMSSIGGAGLFVIAGYLIARARAAPADQIGWAPPEATAAAAARLEAELRARTGERAALESELQAARARIVELDDAIAYLRTELNARDQGANARASVDQALRHELRERGNELAVARQRLEALEAMRGDYVRLRTQRDESEHLRREISRLSAELGEARAGKRRPRLPAPPRLHGDTSSIEASLHQSIGRMLDDSTWAVVVADRVGFPVASVGDDGASLAAYSTLLAEAGERAHAFFSVARPHQLLLIDRDDAQIALWPFEVDGEPLSLVTMSSQPVDDLSAQRAIAEISGLLSRTTPPLKAAN